LYADFPFGQALGALRVTGESRGDLTVALALYGKAEGRIPVIRAALTERHSVGSIPIAALSR
jgi:hypothetical protein